MRLLLAVCCSVGNGADGETRPLSNGLLASRMLSLVESLLTGALDLHVVLKTETSAINESFMTNNVDDLGAARWANGLVNEGTHVVGFWSFAEVLKVLRLELHDEERTLALMTAQALAGAFARGSTTAPMS